MAWTDDTHSNSTNRNTSRFVLLGDTVGSQVSLIPHLRTQEESGRGIPFYFSVSDYVMLSNTSGAA